MLDKLEMVESAIVIAKYSDDLAGVDELWDG
jgi:hypothetical protein